jgi:hypothetical protein
MRDKIITEARSIYAKDYGDVPEHKGCVYWAEAFNQAAAQRGLKAILQAGTAQFQFRADDGVSATHFSYMFDQQAAIERLSKGLWPEMHAWNYIPSTGEIVDLSLKYQPEQARRLCGFEWQPEFALPDYLWMLPEHLTEKMIYRADLPACMLALKFITLVTREIAENILIWDIRPLRNSGLPMLAGL